MREPWHIYNLKRRMTSLPPISEDVYHDTVATTLVSNKTKASDAPSSSTTARTSPKEKSIEESDDENPMEEQDQPNRCLFCTKDSTDLETNFEHMSSDHGLFIPEIEHLSNLEIFLGYLRTVVTEYKECLYCGMYKHSAEGVRHHMVDKSHCMINLEREPELLEFWEFPDSEDGDTDEDEKPTKSRPRKAELAASGELLQGEYILPSGKVVASKTKAQEAKLLGRRTVSATKDSSNELATVNNTDNNPPAETAKSSESLVRGQGGNQGRTIANRDATGLVGVSDHGVRSLITVQRKMQRQQVIVRASEKWADELGGRSQKHSKQKMNLRAG